MTKPRNFTAKVALDQLTPGQGYVAPRGARADLQRQRAVKGNQARRREDELIDMIDMGKAMRAAFRDIWPLMEGRMKDGDIPKLLDLAAPYAVTTLISEMLTSPNARERIDSSKTLAYMAGYQPVQRNLNLEGNLDRMSDDQVTGLIESTFRGMSEDERKLIQQALQKHALLPPKPGDPGPPEGGGGA